MLQEGADVFLTRETIYEALDSLKSCFDQLKRTEKRHLQSQVLITMTSVLLQCDIDGTTHLMELIDLLIETVVQVKRNHPLIRTTCCDCLLEIETFFPGILQKHIESLWAAFQRDSSWACQHYAMVAALVFVHHTGEKESHPVKEAGDLASQRLSVLLNFLPWATPQVASIIFEHLMCLISRSPDMHTLALKALLPKFLGTHELSLLQLGLVPQLNFPEVCFSVPDQILTLQHLIALCNNPLVYNSFKCLVLSWIETYMQHLSTVSKALLTRTEDFEALFPMPVDMPEMQGIKLKIIIANLLWSESTLDLVMHYLRGLKKTSSTQCGFSVNLFFNCMYRLYSDFKDLSLHSTISKEISRLVMDFITSAPLCCHNFLNFLKCVEQAVPESPLSREIISNVVESITNQDLALCLGNLHSNLIILTMAVERPPEICKPQIILKFVQDLVLQTELPVHGDWMTGNQLLDISCAVMMHQRIDPIYSELCKVFSTIMDHYNDVDVRSRAKVFYAALFTLSESKVKKLLQSCNSTSPDRKSHELVDIPTATFPLPSPITRLSPSIIALKKCKGGTSSRCSQSEEISDNTFSSDTFEEYNEFLKHTFNHAVNMPCKIILETDDSGFHRLFGVHLQFYPPQGWGKIEDLVIPVFSNKENGYNVVLSISPRQFQPCHVNIAAEFTCQDTRSYICELPSLSIEFDDLLLPIPILPEFGPSQCSAWRRFIYSQVQENCVKMENVPDSLSIQSVFKLSASSEDIFTKVEDRAKDFIVSKSNLHIDLGLLAPSNCHILLNFKPVEEFTVVSIFTDSWKSLYLIETYLERLTAS
ncbi:AP-5 complex subunit beta-1-like isoform X2 [Ornithodoros turicata]